MNRVKFSCRFIIVLCLYIVVIKNIIEQVHLNWTAVNRKMITRSEIVKWKADCVACFTLEIKGRLYYNISKFLCSSVYNKTTKKDETAIKETKSRWIRRYDSEEGKETKLYVYTF